MPAGDAVQGRLGALQPPGHVIHGQRGEPLAEEQLLERAEKFCATLQVDPSTADGTSGIPHGQHRPAGGSDRVDRLLVHRAVTPSR